MSTIAGTVPGGTPRNGLPGRRNYVYRGTGRDAFTGYVQPDRRPGRPRKDGRCGTCGYRLTAPGHLAACGGSR